MNFVAIIILTSFAVLAIVFLLNVASYKSESNAKPHNQKVTKINDKENVQNRQI